MRGTILAGVVVAVVAAVLATPAFGAVKGWDGTNFFNCTLQQAGDGTTFSDPGADPFCVEYDKTHQDISQLGVVTFLSLEPARLAAAVNKCQYYQRDHWTGEVIAGDGSTQTYHWDGDYFFDKRWGVGGVHVENFTINGQTADPTLLPGFPASWKHYFGPGRGGVLVDSAPRVPSCALPASNPPQQSPYQQPVMFGGVPSPSATPGRARLACAKAGGAVRRGLGRAHLGMTRRMMKRKLGKPYRTAHGFSDYCVRGGGAVAVHFKHGRADLIATNSKKFHAGRARVGKRFGKVLAALKRRHAQYLGRVGKFALGGVSYPKWRLLVGVASRRVAFIGAASNRLSPRRLRALLAAAQR